MIAHPQSLIPEVTQTKRLEGGAEVTANDRHGAEVLIDHRDEGGITGKLRF